MKRKIQKKREKKRIGCTIFEFYFWCLLKLLALVEFFVIVGLFAIVVVVFGAIAVQ